MNEVMTWPRILEKLDDRSDLSRAEAQWAMSEMMSGDFVKEDIINFLFQLRAKGETSQELAGFVDIMLANSLKVPLSQDAIDIVGTGGDQLGTVNISTMAAIVIAASGYPVLKHGSRSASGKTGSSEVLDKLGIRLDLSPAQLAWVFKKTNITFFFAPIFHPALKHVAPIRKEMGVPTTFNFLGPLANPVQPVATALGIANQDLVDLLAAEMAERGRTAIIFRGSDGLDELTITGNSLVKIVHSGEVSELIFDPQTLNIPKALVDQLIGGDSDHNAQVARDLFSGKLGEDSPICQIVAINAAVGITAYELAKSTQAENFEFLHHMQRNYQLAMQSITNGKAEVKLSEWAQASQAAGEQAL